MAEASPSKIVIPGPKQLFEFSVFDQDSKQSFEERVAKHAGLDVEIKSDMEQMKSVKKHKFGLRVNGKLFTVYPDSRSLGHSKEPLEVVQNSFLSSLANKESVNKQEAL
jgi:hypothetical protein